MTRGCVPLNNKRGYASQGQWESTPYNDGRCVLHNMVCAPQEGVCFVMTIEFMLLNDKSRDSCVTKVLDEHSIC